MLKAAAVIHKKRLSRGGDVSLPKNSRKLHCFSEEIRHHNFSSLFYLLDPMPSGASLPALNGGGFKGHFHQRICDSLTQGLHFKSEELKSHTLQTS